LIGLLSGTRTALPPDNRLENELRQQLQQREQELDSTREQLTKSATALATAEANRESAQKLLAETRDLHAANLKAAREAQDKGLADLRQTFQALSAEALRQNSPQFLQLASQTFAKLQENRQRRPVHPGAAVEGAVGHLPKTLATKRIQPIHHPRRSKKTIGKPRPEQPDPLQRNPAIAPGLSSNQARGRWGEETLRRVVEAAGMSPHCDFAEQHQVDDKKPDLIVRLPGNRVIIVDSKVPDLRFFCRSSTPPTPPRARKPWRLMRTG